MPLPQCNFKKKETEEEHHGKTREKAGNEKTHSDISRETFFLEMDFFLFSLHICSWTYLLIVIWYWYCCLLFHWLLVYCHLVLGRLVLYWGQTNTDTFDQCWPLDRSNILLLKLENFLTFRFCLCGFISICIKPNCNP